MVLCTLARVTSLSIQRSMRRRRACWRAEAAGAGSSAMTGVVTTAFSRRTVARVGGRASYPQIPPSHTPPLAVPMSTAPMAIRPIATMNYPQMIIRGSRHAAPPLQATLLKAGIVGSSAMLKYIIPEWSTPLGITGPSMPRVPSMSIAPASLV